MPERYELDEKVVLITGAGGGLGSALARELSERGARVALLDLDLEAAERAAAALDEDRTFALGGDVTDLESMRTAVTATIDHFGQLDVAVANAGILGRGATFRNLSTSEVEKVMSVNVNGVVNTAMTAYFALLDTDMIGEGVDAHPEVAELLAQTPRYFLKRIHPTVAAAAIADGLEAREQRVLTPRRWSPFFALQGAAGMLADGRSVRTPAMRSALTRLETRDLAPDKTAALATTEPEGNTPMPTLDRISARLTNLVARKAPALGRRATVSHVDAYRSSNGRKRNTLAGRPVFLLDVVGRSSGESRPVMLMHAPRGDDLVVVGSGAGSDATPNWYKNLMAAGGGAVQVGAQRWSVTPASSPRVPSETNAGPSPPRCTPGSTRTRPSPTAPFPSLSWSAPRAHPDQYCRDGCFTSKADRTDSAHPPSDTTEHARTTTMNTTDRHDDSVVRSYADAPTRTVTARGTTYAYRELGPTGDIPVVFFVHLAGTLDNWDPRIVDAIAKDRHVIAFDNKGVGASTGKVPDEIETMADDAYTFITALGLDKIDIFSFSLGGFIAQDLVVKHPDLVRKLVLTGTGPRGGTGIDKVVAPTYWDTFRASILRADPKEFLFFNRDVAGKAAGKAFIERLGERTVERDEKITLRAFRNQLKAIVKFGRSAPSDLSTLTQPTLIANGDNDRMVPSNLSDDLHRRIAGSELVMYPDSGHGAVFQFHEQFTPIAAEFLNR